MYASIVIPTYNRRDILENTLNSLLNQSISFEQYEIIVVDDCSSDNTYDYMQNMCKLAHKLTYIRHNNNEGRVQTRNDGIKASHGEIVIFLDDDNVPDYNFVEAHILCHSRHIGQSIAVMGNASYCDEIIRESNFARFLQSRYLGFRSSSDRMTIDYENLPSRCLATLNCSMRRSDLLAVGMFDNAFRYYGGEDGYMGYCLNQIGIKIVFEENARTLHYDDISILRYKNKILETSKFGINILLEKCPDFLEKTKLVHLLPIDLQKDTHTRIITKIFIRSILNPLTLKAVERLALFTDKCSFFYVSAMYRFLIAGWSIQGQKLKADKNVFVTYESK